MPRHSPPALRQIILAALLAAAICRSSLAAHDAIGFSRMEIYRFDRNTTALQFFDLNRDGFDDIIFANNNASRLEVLLRKCAAPPDESGRTPQLEETFVNAGVMLDQQVIACRVLELPQNPAILTLGRELGLQMHVFADNALQPPQKIFVAAPDRLVDIQTADFDRDGAADIAVCRKDEQEILWNEKGDFSRRTLLPLTPPDALKIEVGDCTGDAFPDLLIFFGTDPNLLRLRPGTGTKKFGPEYLLPIAPARRSTLVALSNSAPAMLASLTQNGRGARLYTVAATNHSDVLQQAEVTPARIPLRGISQRTPPCWIVDDFNRDGLDDFCVTAPDLAQLHIYDGTASGLAAEPRAIDTLANANALSRTADGRLLVFSASEKTAALHALNRPDDFPALYRLPQTNLVPLMAIAHPVHPKIIWLAQDAAQDDAMLLVIQPLESPMTNAPDVFALPLPNAPDAISAYRLNDDNAFALMFFIPYQPPQLFTVAGTNAPVPVAQIEYNPAAAALRPGMLAWSNGRLLAAAGKAAREFSASTTGWQPVRQFSPDDKTADISAAAFYRTAAKTAQVLLFDQAGRDLLVFTDGTETPHRCHIAFDLPAPLGLAPLRNARKKSDQGILLVAPRDIFILYNGPAFTTRQVAEYFSPSEEPSLADVREARLGSPRRPILAMLDTRNRAAELTEYAAGNLTLRMAFEVFQDPAFGSSRGGIEPHDIASGDVNGDGIGDLGLLVHDKLIVYFGE